MGPTWFFPLLFSFPYSFLSYETRAFIKIYSNFHPTTSFPLFFYHTKHTLSAVNVRDGFLVIDVTIVSRPIWLTWIWLNLVDVEVHCRVLFDSNERLYNRIEWVNTTLCRFYLYLANENYMVKKSTSVHVSTLLSSQ